MEYTVDIRLIHFALTAVFSFLVGLEIKTYQLQFHAAETKQTIGSVRTLTFIGVLGYLFWILDGRLYLAGFGAVTLLFGLFFLRQLREGKTSILLYLVMLVVYSFGPLTERFALWLPSLLFVLTIFMLNAKQRLRELSKRLNGQELETLGKMVLLSAVILPLLPHQKLGAYLPLSPFEIWMAVVIVSTISYSGYLAQKYFFRQKGYLLAGLIGGLYSSTATTVVLARKASEIGNTRLMTAGIVAATAMMYLRLIAVAAIFNLEVAKALLLPFAGFALAGILIASLYAFRRVQANSDVVAVDTNPLELRTAFVFAGLFIGMMALTQLVTVHYGTDGLRILSFIVGFTDIDPFVLSLLTGHYAIGEDVIVSSVMIAAGSNNLLKALYAVWFGGVGAGKSSAVWLLLLGFMTIAVAFVM
jgi:uncharacterized membrane protein (DUF4010 family)